MASQNLPPRVALRARHSRNIDPSEIPRSAIVPHIGTLSGLWEDPAVDPFLSRVSALDRYSGRRINRIGAGHLTASSY